MFHVDEFFQCTKYSWHPFCDLSEGLADQLAHHLFLLDSLVAVSAPLISKRSLKVTKTLVRVF